MRRCARTGEIFVSFRAETEAARELRSSAPAWQNVKLRALFGVEVRANRHGVVRINGGGIKINVLDPAVLADDERGTASEFDFVTGHVVGVHDAISGKDFAIHVA